MALMTFSVAEWQVDDDVADGRQSAEGAEFFQQTDFGAPPRGGQCGRHARYAAADYDNIICSKNLKIFCWFVNGGFHGIQMLQRVQRREVFSPALAC